jgi:triphosphoribosyl-dephospho-CoA synthase
LHQTTHRTAKHVSGCLQLAILLEVSAHKPGNVNRATGFQNTRYEHFLASAVAVEPGFAYAAQLGIMVSEGKIELNEISIGEIIRNVVVNVNAWQHGGNTLLGTVLLLSPIAAASGMTLAKNNRFSVSRLRENIKLVIESTTPSDAVAVYEAINIANPSGLVDKAPTLDVNDPKSKETILEENVTLYDVFKISAPYDSISREWVENYPITFKTGFPFFAQQLDETGSLNTAIVNTFLKVLSSVPDTLIVRKVGLEKAKEISEKAREILRLGGLTTARGRDKLSSFDKELRGSANRYNPGTTADIIAAVLAVSILNGYRP